MVAGRGQRRRARIQRWVKAETRSGRGGMIKVDVWPGSQSANTGVRRPHGRVAGGDEGPSPLRRPIGGPGPAPMTGLGKGERASGRMSGLVWKLVCRGTGESHGPESSATAGSVGWKAMVDGYPTQDPAGGFAYRERRWLACDGLPGRGKRYPQERVPGRGVAYRHWRRRRRFLTKNPAGRKLGGSVPRVGSHVPAGWT
jgi:hypothetical protein